MSPFSRPRAVIGAVAVGITVLVALAGCSPSAPAPSSGSSAESSVTASAQAAASGTRVVNDTFLGDVEIPVSPQRVVALWRVGSELAELGVVPVGAMTEEIAQSELTPEQWEPVKDVPTVGSFEDIDIEKVIALAPDLIIGMDNGGLGIDYTELQQVAPTLIYDIAEPTDVWKNYPSVAEAVGKTTDFDASEADLEAALGEIKSEHGDQISGLKTTLVSASFGSILVDTSKSLAYERITGAGFGYNPIYTAAPERYVTEITKEQIPELADQDIIFYSIEFDGTVGEEMQALMNEESWKRLPAVAAGHVYPIGGTTSYTFAAADQQVEQLRTAAADYTAAG